MSLFNELRIDRVTSWSGRPGEVAHVFVAQVEKARQRLQSEKEPEFVPLWEWCLALAEEDLRRESERAKEERGE
jgi:hypothetical protein